MNTNEYIVRVNGIPYEVEIEAKVASNQSNVNRPVVSTVNNTNTEAKVQAQVTQAQAPKPMTQGGEKVLSPMQGKIVTVAVAKGQSVKKGQALVGLEAMKMENEIVASKDAQVADVHVTVGQSVEANDILMTLA